MITKMRLDDLPPVLCSRCGRSAPEGDEIVAWLFFGDDATGPLECVCPECATSADRQRLTDEREIEAAMNAVDVEQFLREVQDAS